MQEPLLPLYLNSPRTPGLEQDCSTPNIVLLIFDILTEVRIIKILLFDLHSLIAKDDDLFWRIFGISSFYNSLYRSQAYIWTGHYLFYWLIISWVLCIFWILNPLLDEQPAKNLWHKVGLHFTFNYEEALVWWNSTCKLLAIILGQMAGYSGSSSLHWYHVGYWPCFPITV